MLGRQQFQHYPLSNKELTSIMQDRQTIQKDINETMTQIRMLNSKMTKNENEMIYLKRLSDRERVLDNQKRQMEEILRTHQYLQNQADSIMKSEHNFRATLGGEYRAAMQEKRNKQQEDKRRRIEEQQMLLHLNKRSIQIDQEKKKKEMVETKRRFNQELIQLEIQRQHQKDEKQKQKQEFNKNLAKKYSQQTQKDAAYKQYYNQFLINKSLPKNGYSDKPVQPNYKEKPRSESTQKQRLDVNKEEAKVYEDQSSKAPFGKQTLKSYLSQQINEKQKKKQEQAENKRVFNEQYVSSQQNSQKQYEQQIRQKKRDQQRKYQEQLTNQIRQKQTIFRERQSSPHRFYNNNVSPIDMKLKDTYGGNQYEDKDRNSGERQFKMRNLAMVGSNSIQ